MIDKKNLGNIEFNNKDFKAASELYSDAIEYYVKTKENTKVYKNITDYK